MGLFDIFRRHKKKEEEKTPESSSAVVQSETAHDDESADATSAAPASAPTHPEPVNIPYLDEPRFSTQRISFPSYKHFTISSPEDPLT